MKTWDSKTCWIDSKGRNFTRYTYTVNGVKKVMTIIGGKK